MSKKNAPVAEPRTATAPSEPKGFEIPSLENHPAVVAAVSRHDALREQLATARRTRVQLERELGAKSGESDEELEAKLLARGQSTDGITKLREARRTERVTAQAVELVADDVRKARETATRELTAVVREEVFLPGVRAAVRDWLDAVKRIEAFRLVVEDIQTRGVGSNTFSPFNGRVPVSLADRDGFAEFARELIHDGHTDAATVNAAFPDLL
ncbi:hypothetical protein GobsT_23330 [Gemmata obscuriglobus]|uniref:Uncharacterized protein n=1 Tax=Gemmata obscuriglobus TaxID=114 RepID=A0A2Z3HCF0_9BACT|nr:hypothetical protein [Gemmata obscuriglobus]AWM39354.1 hypothetical protein C1280_21780 [Gemmata obscuriglobus]QEG27577.1 hypothetical protein GobsT_23330 [Gemmata obscuriglobus]VTS04675.1 unnamed protein product [Gemmata obscuriglobus UQM 2246]